MLAVGQTLVSVARGFLHLYFQSLSSILRTNPGELNSSPTWYLSDDSFHFCLLYPRSFSTIYLCFSLFKKGYLLIWLFHFKNYLYCGFVWTLVQCPGRPGFRSLELELEAVMSCRTWVPGTEQGPSSSTAHAPHCWAASHLQPHPLSLLITQFSAFGQRNCSTF